MTSERLPEPEGILANQEVRSATLAADKALAELYEIVQGDELAAGLEGVLDLWDSFGSQFNLSEASEGAEL